MIASFWKRLVDTIRDPQPKDTREMRLGIALLCWFSALLLLPAMIVSGAYVPALTWVIWIVVLLATVLIGVDVFCLANRRSPWTLLAAVAALAVYYLLSLIGFAMNNMWDVFLFNGLFPLAVMVLALIDLILKGKLRKIVRVSLTVLIGLYLFYIIFVMPFVGRYTIFDSTLSPIALWMAMLLYWLYVPLATPEFTTGSTAQPFAPAPQVLQPSAFETKLAELKQKHESGELNDEEYEEQRTKVLEMM